VPVEDRIATFDQDATLWVEHPIYTQVMYCLDRVDLGVRYALEGDDHPPALRGGGMRHDRTFATAREAKAVVQ
jgi:hypothetical protein